MVVKCNSMYMRFMETRWRKDIAAISNASHDAVLPVYYTFRFLSDCIATAHMVKILVYIKFMLFVCANEKKTTTVFDFSLFSVI